MRLINKNITRLKTKFIVTLLHCLIITSFFTACREHYTPKRNGYFRIDFPKERNYVTYSNSICPFTFEYADNGIIQQDSSNLEDLHQHPCWFNIIYPDYMAKIYISYTEISTTEPLDKLIKDSYKLTFKHTVKADYIDETVVKGKNKNVHGILYDVGGNAASAVQFYVTDSVHNFIRGSLYFFAAPNVDSIAPSVAYFRNDVVHLIETLQWK